jgi:hypothetical protein
MYHYIIASIIFMKSGETLNIPNNVSKKNFKYLLIYVDII